MSSRTSDLQKFSLDFKIHLKLVPKIGYFQAMTDSIRYSHYILLSGKSRLLPYKLNIESVHEN